MYESSESNNSMRIVVFELKQPLTRGYIVCALIDLSKHLDFINLLLHNSEQCPTNHV